MPGLPAARRRDEEVQGHAEGDHHRGQLAPGVDAPPEPAEDEEQARAGADLEQDVESLEGVLEAQGHGGGDHHQNQGRQPADPHQAPLARVRLEEALVEVVGDVGGAPVEVGRDGGHVGRRQRSDHQAEPAGGQEGEHRRVGEVVPHDRRVDVREGRPQGIEIREDHERAQRYQDPRPRAQGIVGDVEEQRRADGVVLVLGGQHPLRDVAAAAGLRARVPGRPPLNGQRHEEQGDDRGSVAEVR